MGKLTNILEPNNLRLAFSAYNFGKDVMEDLSFVRTLWRGLGPTGRNDKVEVPKELFPTSRPLTVPALAGKRIGLVSSGGSGATASLCGVRRAFEDAGLEVSAISACSGSVLFAALWACGLSAEDMARFWLSLPTRGYVDPAWGSVLRAPWRLFGGFGGLLRGEAVERSFRHLLGERTLGQTKIPFSAVVWNIDRNQVEHLSTRGTPDLAVARAARIAISIPIMVEPVRMGDHYYGDGGIVDIFPVQPLLDEQLDVVIGLNCYLPEAFGGEDITGWYDRPFSILRASGQLRYATYLELAREHVRQLGSRLSLLDPVPYEEVRGAKFYQSFLDRSSWPRFMQLGYEAGRQALARLGQEGTIVAAA